ncbi:hypothetical protein, partial [uncultured Helicobacter sp.]
MKGFSYLKIGTKLMSAIGLISALGFGVLAYIISINVNADMVESTSQTLRSEVKAQTNYVSAAFGELNAVTLNTKNTLDNVFASTAIENISLARIDNVISSLASSSYLVSYAFLYVPDAPAHFKTDPIFQTQSDKTIIVRSDKDNVGKSHKVQAQDQIAEFPSIQVLLSAVKSGQKIHKPFIGKPKQITIDEHSFMGTPILFPVYGVNGKFVGIIGSVLNFDFLRLYVADKQVLNFEGENRALLDQDGIVAMHTMSDRTQKRLQDLLNKDDQDVIEALNTHKDGVYDYITSSGVPSYLIIQPFALNDEQDTQWMMLISVPKNIILQNVENLLILVVISSCIILVFVLTALYILVRKIISGRLPDLLTGLHKFFEYVNHETQEVSLIRVKAHDELGKIAMMVNQNINRTKDSLEQDEQAITQAAQTAKAVEDGDLTARIDKDPANPQLKELKDVLNHMLSTLQTKIGSDTNEIARVFNAYTQLDFSTEVKDAQGRVEVVTNTLGQEIKKMLQASSNFAKD